LHALIISYLLSEIIIRWIAEMGLNRWEVSSKLAEVKELGG